MRSAFALSLVTAFGLLVPLASGQDKDEQTATGKIVLSRPTFKFEAGNIYEATATGKDFQPSVQVNYSDLSTHYPFSTGPFDPTKRNIHRIFLLAKKTGDFPVLVSYPGIPSTDPITRASTAFPRVMTMCCSSVSSSRSIRPASPGSPS